jgi:N-acetylmuramate 1-kinase
VLHTLILAAGLGTRLRPLTERIAKPLIPIADNCPLGRQALLAKKIGSAKIHANAHHLAEQVQNAATELGIDKVWFEPEILGTGGPIQRMYKEGERGELLVLNGDCEHNLDIESFLENARNSGATCALLAIDNPEINTLCIKDGRLVGIENRFGEKGTENATFTGISWYSEKAWEQVADRDIWNFWDKWLKKGENIFVQIAAQNSLWIDIGSPKGLMKAVSSKNPESFAIAGSAGSGRKYYRMACAGHSLILQQSYEGDPDFERFVRYGKLFNTLELPTPEIYAVDEKEKRVVMEDLGSIRLCDATQPMLHYPAVLEKLIVWQEASERAFALDSELANRIFDEDYYLWETSYFAENYLGYTEIPADLSVFFKDLAKKAVAQPKVLMHRDFQSQNIMLSGESKIAFIDFQGARNGSIYYDVASLLWDPYMMIPAETVEQLFTLWLNANPLLKGVSFEQAWEDFIIASAQRLMQALGAYCFLSKKKGIKSFEQYIEPGARRLAEITSPHPLNKLLKLR